MISVARTVTDNVKRWRNGAMILRWTAAGVLEAERQFRRVNGFPTHRNNSRQFKALTPVGAGYDAGMRGCVLCRSQLLTPVVHATKSWRTAINRNQNLLGKLIVVLDRHEEVITALTQDEWAELHREVRWATERLRQAFAPDHLNYV